MNNLLQENPSLGTLKYEVTATRGHQGPWTATATGILVPSSYESRGVQWELTGCAAVNGVEYGTGRGNSKAAAREAAAKVAFAELRKRLDELREGT